MAKIKLKPAAPLVGQQRSRSFFTWLPTVILGSIYWMQTVTVVEAKMVVKGEVVYDLGDDVKVAGPEFTRNLWVIQRVVDNPKKS